MIESRIVADVRPKFRNDSQGEFDETWFSGVNVHIERMSETAFWIGFDFPDGSRVMLNTGVQRGVWYFNLEEDRLGTDRQCVSVRRPRSAKTAPTAKLLLARKTIERMTKALNETVDRLEILLMRGDLSSDPDDEKITRGWLSRCMEALKLNPVQEREVSEWRDRK